MSKLIPLSNTQQSTDENNRARTGMHLKRKHRHNGIHGLVRMHFYCPSAPNNEKVALFLRGSQNKVHHKKLSEYGVIYRLQNPERRWHKEALSRQLFTGSLLLKRELQLNPARPISWWSEDRCRALLLAMYMWASRKNKQLHNNGGISRD